MTTTTSRIVILLWLLTMSHSLITLGAFQSIKSTPLANFRWSTNSPTSSRYMSSRFPENEQKSSNLEVIAGVSGTVSNLICGYSLFVLKTTGCGLPPGPFGLEGAAEGISYLVVIGIFLWSLVTKVKSGRGLPDGPFGILGLAEGLSFLTVIAGVAIGVINLGEYGFLPGFLPNDKCFASYIIRIRMIKCGIVLLQQERQILCLPFCFLGTFLEFAAGLIRLFGNKLRDDIIILKLLLQDSIILKNLLLYWREFRQARDERSGFLFVCGSMSAAKQGRNGFLVSLGWFVSSMLGLSVFEQSGIGSQQYRFRRCL
eukprot:gene4150-8251_t